jgi:hypothetical protein
MIIKNHPLNLNQAEESSSSKSGSFLVGGLILAVFLASFSSVLQYSLLAAKEKQNKNKCNRVEIVFTDHDRRVIHDYYGSHYSNLPPGLAKRGGDLPPGLEKQLRRNGTLPPGLQKRVEPLPHDLEMRLPPLPERSRRVTIGGRIMILDDHNSILDVMVDIER